MHACDQTRSMHVDYFDLWRSTLNELIWGSDSGLSRWTMMKTETLASANLGGVVESVFGARRWRRRQRRQRWEANDENEGELCGILARFLWDFVWRFCLLLKRIFGEERKGLWWRRTWLVLEDKERKDLYGIWWRLRNFEEFCWEYFWSDGPVLITAT